MLRRSTGMVRVAMAAATSTGGRGLKGAGEVAVERTLALAASRPVPPTRIDEYVPASPANQGDG